MGETRKRWIDRTRPLWKIGNRLEAFQLRRFGWSPMSMVNPGKVLLLETTGRRTGRRRFAPIAYWPDEHGGYVVGGGAAGMATVPDWVRNLRAEPRAAVWIRRVRTPVLAEELHDRERDRAQQQAAEIWRSVASYERKSGRVIPYFRLRPAD
jgi:deazaflavin-dependent oxidoreductase (nitroreductase family)